MKKSAALLLALAVMLFSVPALAADYTLEEKFIRQVQQSAFRGQITFEATGDSTAVMDENAWQTIKALAPRLLILGDHTFQRGEGQATVEITLDGESAGKTVYLYNDDLRGFSSDLLAGADSFFTFPAPWDAGRLLAAFQGDNAWPPVWEILLSAMRADEEWQNQAQIHFTNLETRLGVWLNGFIESTTGVTEEGVDYTQLSFAIPGDEVKAEIRALLADFYGDPELLALLGERVSPRAAAAYLQPAAMDGLLLMVDALALQDEMKIIRRYDSRGQSLLDEIVLPFSEGSALTGLTITVSAEEGSQRWQVKGGTREGLSFLLSGWGEEKTHCAGWVEITLPAGEGSSEMDTTLSFDYALEWEIGEEIYSLSTDKFEKTLKGSLTLTPRTGSSFPAQSLTVEAALSSGSAQRSATRLEGALIWRDLEKDAWITATLDSRTAAPFQPQSLDDVKGALRLDQMDDPSLSALAARWLESAEDWLDALATRLLAGGNGPSI